jgi:hypothetical protein
VSFSKKKIFGEERRIVNQFVNKNRIKRRKQISDR